MAIRKNPVLHELNCQEIGKRLRMARMSCGMSQSEVAVHLNHDNATQISLWEGGDRLPPILELIRMSFLYMTPTDFLLGTIDDPVSDPMETRFALGAKAVSESLKGQFLQFCDIIGQSTAMALDQRDYDRRDAKAMAEMAGKSKVALKRVIELNPEFEEDWRGASNLMNALDQMIGLGEKAAERIGGEEKKFAVIEREMSFKSLTDANQQYFMPLVIEE